MDKLICEKDYKVCFVTNFEILRSFFQETQQTCSDCGCVIVGPYYTLDDDKVVCEKDYKVSQWSYVGKKWCNASEAISYLCGFKS